MVAVSLALGWHICVCTTHACDEKKMEGIYRLPARASIYATKIDGSDNELIPYVQCSDSRIRVCPHRIHR